MFDYRKCVRPDSDVGWVFQLAEQGLNKSQIAREVGITRFTVRDWLLHGEDAVLERPMRVGSHRRPAEECGERCVHSKGLDESQYAYLLGQYLGDGCISNARKSFKLRIACCDDYPDIMAECASAIRSVKPDGSVGFVTRVGCTEVYSQWLHWPCLLPHGDGGRKHERYVELEQWQREIAIERYPDRFVRGLIHSDGCRCINRIRRPTKTYQYVRYFFANESLDIQRLFFEACDQLGIAARNNDFNSISVSRRESVEKMDAIVGPKT